MKKQFIVPLQTSQCNYYFFFTVILTDYIDILKNIRIGMFNVFCNPTFALKDESKIIKISNPLHDSTLFNKYLRILHAM